MYFCSRSTADKIKTGFCMIIRLAYSPDSDDFFMFHPALSGLIDTDGYEFIPQTHDTQKLNDIVAENNLVDVSAVSLHAYAYFHKNYFLLPHGASVGRNYGPVLITKQPNHLSGLSGKSIAIPGLQTTAYLVLKLMIPDAKPQIVPIEPFYRIFDEIDYGNVDAGLLIHEGRLFYQERGFYLVQDIGKWWFNRYQLPLPLGVNVIRKSLGSDHIRNVSRILKSSIQYSLNHRDDMIKEWMKIDKRGVKELESYGKVDEYLSLYANADTAEFTDDTKKAAQLLMNLGFENGIIPHHVKLEWSE